MSSSSSPPLTPARPPSPTHEVIAVLESLHVPWAPECVRLPPPRTYEALVYHHTVAGRDDVAARIRDASVVVCTTCRLTAETLREAPHLKLIIGHAVGTDHIDLEYCRQNGIQVMNSTNCNSETVAEHAMSLYFATRRSIVKIHNILTDFTPSRPNEWKAKGSLHDRMRDPAGAPPRTCREEVAGIVGYGAVGQHIARLCTALGMKVLIAERKQQPSPTTSSTTSPTTSTSPSPPRLPLPAVLAAATVLFLAVPLTRDTTGLLSGPELALLAPHAVVINVSRGGVADEPAVLAALAARRLHGYGTDVFAVEPAGDGRDSVLLAAAARAGDSGSSSSSSSSSSNSDRNGDGEGKGEGEEKEDRLNLVMTAHLAWLSGTTITNQKRRVGENLWAWAEGQGRGDVVVAGRRA